MPERTSHGKLSSRNFGNGDRRGIGREQSADTDMFCLLGENIVIWKTRK